MFSLTPPPSEQDEFDSSALMSCSPSMSTLCYPSPTPSHQAPSQPSGRSKSIYMPPNDISFSEEPNPSAESAEMYFVEPSDSSIFPIVVLPNSDMSAYNSTTATEAFPALYDQPGQWLPYSTYSTPGQISYMYDQQSGSVFANYEQGIPQSLTGIIPPTPQDIAPADTNFNFNSPPTLDSIDRRQSIRHQYTASPSFSQLSQRSSHQESRSSVSRSCSPNPSNSYQMTVAVGAASSASSASSATIMATASNAGVSNKTLRPSLRSNSTSSNSSLHAYGIPLTPDPSSMHHSISTIVGPPPSSSSASQSQAAWRCAYPGCTSRATFTRGCDLRKHYNRHSKHLFCRVDGCPQSEAAIAAKTGVHSNGFDSPLLTGGFSSKKDRARHEAKHNPGIRCEWRNSDGEQCGRLFSRMDNMKDHVRRIHKKSEHQTS